jgi:hypothetical protein
MSESDEKRVFVSPEADIVAELLQTGYSAKYYWAQKKRIIASILSRWLWEHDIKSTPKDRGEEHDR